MMNLVRIARNFKSMNMDPSLRQPRESIRDTSMDRIRRKVPKYLLSSSTLLLAANFIRHI